MSCNYHFIIFLLLIVCAASYSYLCSINRRCNNLISGGRIIDTVSKPETDIILDKYAAVKKIGFYNYEFNKNIPTVMDITKSVVS
jgi:hypothetical protein